MQTKIEKLTFTDINEVFRISMEQFGNESWSLSQFGECLNNESYINFVLLVDNKIVSFLIAQELPDFSINLLLIATKKQFKNLGLASLLINHLFKNSPGKRIWLEVKKTNISAINLYEKTGFKFLYERKNYYKDGSSAIIFEKL